jgi:digeranylgeranylglycerophospholipid reductase
MEDTTLHCDVLIVGGGPAGLSVAAGLPDEVSAVVVHQDQEIGLPVRTSGGSWLRDAKRLGIPPEMYQVVRQTEAFADRAHSVIPMAETVVILNTPRLYQWLAAQSDHKNRKLLLATKFLTTELRADGLYESQIRGRDGGPERVVSRYIVDGSGWHHAVLRALGLTQKPERLGVGTEYEYPIGTNAPDRAIVFVGRKVPSGYGWAFPTNVGTLRVGVGVIQPDTDASPRKLLDAVVANEKLLKRYGLSLPDTPLEVHSGILPSVAYDDRMVFGNVIRVGDSANFATPTLGEGIRHCIELGRVLGAALGETLKTGSRRPLKAYERRARRKLKRDYKWGFLINTRISEFTPQRWNASVRRMGVVGPEAVTGLFRNEFSRAKIARMVMAGGRRWLLARLRRKA